MVADADPQAVVVVALQPLRGTSMEAVAPPPATEVVEVLRAARESLPATLARVGLRPTVRLGQGAARAGCPGCGGRRGSLSRPGRRRPRAGRRATRRVPRSLLQPGGGAGRRARQRRRLSARRPASEEDRAARDRQPRPASSRARRTGACVDRPGCSERPRGPLLGQRPPPRPDGGPVARRRRPGRHARAHAAPRPRPDRHEGLVRPRRLRVLHRAGRRRAHALVHDADRGVRRPGDHHRRRAWPTR